MAREFVGRWTGHIREGSEADHERFVERLRTPETATLLGKYSLTEYAMYQKGNDLEIIFKSDKQTIIPGFLRNKPLWPDFWEFTGPGQSDAPSDKAEVFHWTRA